MLEENKDIKTEYTSECSIMYEELDSDTTVLLKTGAETAPKYYYLHKDTLANIKSTSKCCPYTRSAIYCFIDGEKLKPFEHKSEDGQLSWCKDKATIEARIRDAELEWSEKLRFDGQALGQSTWGDLTPYKFLESPDFLEKAHCWGRCYMAFMTLALLLLPPTLPFYIFAVASFLFICLTALSYIGILRLFTYIHETNRYNNLNRLYGTVAEITSLEPIVAKFNQLTDSDRVADLITDVVRSYRSLWVKKLGIVLTFITFGLMQTHQSNSTYLLLVRLDDPSLSVAEKKDRIIDYIGSEKNPGKALFTLFVEKISAIEIEQKEAAEPAVLAA